MGQARVKIKQIILLAGDIGILYFSLYLTLALRYHSDYEPKIWQNHFIPFTLIYALWVVVFFIQNLYNLNFAKNNLRFYRLFFESLLVNALLSVGFFYLIPYFGITPKTNLFLDVVLVALLLPIWRSVYNRTIAASLLKNKIIFIGDTKETREIIEALNKEPQFGYKALALVNLNDEPPKELAPCSICKLSDLNRLIQNQKVDTIALAARLSQESRLSRYLYKALFSQITFVDLISFYEGLTGKIPVFALSEVWFLENLKESEKKFYDSAKMTVDYLLSFFLLLSMLFFVPIISLLIWLLDGRPVFYSQKRTGKNGKVFRLHKFRTMVCDAEKDGIKFALLDDKRVTRLGKFLRRTRLDELPQIWNVLRGEMSFVGPRPERPEFVAELEAAMPFYPIRHLAKPGLTGWAQINYPYAGSLEENLKKLQYDIYYIKNRSVLLDLAILLKTLNIVLRWKGQ